MTEPLVVCEKAGECYKKGCPHINPHMKRPNSEPGPCVGWCTTRSDRDKCIPTGEETE